MISRFPRRAAALVLLLGLLLAACANEPEVGSSGGGAEAPAKSNPLEAFTLAASKTSDAKTAKMAMTIKGDGGGAAQDFTSEGAIDFASGEMRMTMSAGAAGTIEMLSNGKVIYMKSPQPLPGGKTWLKMDLEALAKQSGTDLGALTEGANNDPTQALAYLKAAANDVKEVGKEQVRGADTTHYTATIDLRKAMEAQPAEKRKAMEKLLDSTTQTTFPADVWIDGEGRLRKMEYVIETKAGDAGSVKLESTTEFFDFGAPVDVELPADSETADFSELLSGIGG